MVVWHTLNSWHNLRRINSDKSPGNNCDVNPKNSFRSNSPFRTFFWLIVKVGDSLVNSLMRSFLIKVICIFSGYPRQMPTIKNECMVQAFSSQAAHESFTNAIGSGRSIRRSQFLDTWTCCYCRKVRTIFAVAIVKEIFRTFTPGCCFTQLLSGPFIGGRGRNCNMDNPAGLEHY